MIFGVITALSAVIAAVITTLIGSFDSLGFLWLMLGSFAGSFLLLTLVAFLFLMLVCAFVDMKKPQESDSKFYRTIMYPYIEALMQIVMIRLHTQGLEKTPQGWPLPAGVQPSERVRPRCAAALLQKKPAGLHFQKGKCNHVRSGQVHA